MATSLRYDLPMILPFTSSIWSAVINKFIVLFFKEFCLSLQIRVTDSLHVSVGINDSSTFGENASKGIL